MCRQPPEYYRDRNLALAEMARLLRSGSLCLFLGAGVSGSMRKFPSWVQLVEACCKDVGIDRSVARDEPIDSLLRLMEEVKDACGSDDAYRSLVSRCLHQKALVPRDSMNMLLIALGALLMPSVRGHASEIVTYNFDDSLEWLLELHGLVPQVVSTLPFMERTADVRVFHPHGFLPRNTSHLQAKRFVFDGLAYDSTVGNELDPWFRVCKDLLLRKVGLFVGLSGEDPALRTLVARVNDHLREQREPRTVAFLLSRVPKPASPEERDRDMMLARRGVARIPFPHYAAIWDFILRVCQRATISS